MVVQCLCKCKCENVLQDGIIYLGLKFSLSPTILRHCAPLLTQCKAVLQKENLLFCTSVDRILLGLRANFPPWQYWKRLFGIKETLFSHMWPSWCELESCPKSRGKRSLICMASWDVHWTETLREGGEEKRPKGRPSRVSMAFYVTEERGQIFSFLWCGPICVEYPVRSIFAKYYARQQIRAFILFFNMS